MKRGFNVLIFSIIVISIILLIGFLSITRVSAEIKIIKEQAEIGSSFNLNEDDIVVKNAIVDLSSKIITIGSEGEIKIKDTMSADYNEYKVKQGSKFKFENGDLTDGTEFIVEKESNFRLKGHDFKLPENTKVIFENGKVIIELPEGSKIETPEIKDREEAKNSEFEFKTSGGKIKLPNEMVFNGNLKYRVIDDNGDIYGKFYFNDKKANIDRIGDIDNEKEREIGLYFNGKTQNPRTGSTIDLGPYISIGEDKLVLGQNTEEAGPKIVLKQGNYLLKEMKEDQYLILQAGKDSDERGSSLTGLVTINSEKDGKPSRIITENGMRIENSGKTVKTGIYPDGNFGFFRENKEEKGSPYAIEISSYKDNKPLLTNSEGNDFKFLMHEKGWDVIPLDYNINLNELMSGSFSSGSDVPRVSEKWKSNMNYLNGLKISSAPEYARYDNNPRFRGGGDISTMVHEDIHININNALSQGDYRAFYLGNGEYALVKEVGLVKGDVIARKGNYWNDNNILEAMITPNSGAAPYIPLEIVNKGILTNYFGSMFSNRDITHVFEDWSAFQGGAKAYFNQVLTTRVSPGSVPNDLEAVTDFIVFGFASGEYVQNKNTEYWNSPNGEQFRGYIKRATEDSMSLVNQAYSDSKLSAFRKGNDIDVDWGPTPGVQEKLQQLRTSQTQQAISMRKFAIETYGSEWTQKVLGFDKP